MVKKLVKTSGGLQSIHNRLLVNGELEFARTLAPRPVNLGGIYHGVS